MDIDKLLNKIGSYYAARLRRNLKAEGNFATGGLDKSIRYRVDGNTLNIFSEYGEGQALLSVSEGRKKSGKNPSKLMITRVIGWMKVRGMRPLIRGRGGRFRKQTESTYRKSAFAVARGILRKGYAGSRVIERSYRELENKIDKDILKEFNMSIETELKNITISKNG